MSKTAASSASATTGSGRPVFSTVSARIRSPAKLAAMAAVDPSAAPIEARRPSETKMVAPTRAPEAARPSRGGGDVRLGVTGNLSPTNSPNSINTSAFEMRGEPRKAKIVPSRSRSPRLAARLTKAGPESERRPEMAPRPRALEALKRVRSCTGGFETRPLRSYARALHTSSLVLMWRMISSVNSVVPAEPPRSAVFTPSRTVSKVAS